MRSKFLCVVMMGCCFLAQAQSYAPALPGYHYEFPRDYFNHPAYQTEWWYYTGNLRGRDGHRFGFELTFFRQGVSRDASATPWSLHDLYMAHLALTDISGRRYFFTERINRAGPGIAAFDAPSGTIWNGNWQTRIDENAHVLRGVGDNFSFDLTLAPQKPVVIHGQNGVSQKAEGLGHASHYLSFTRMTTAGTVDLEGTTYKVDGDAWMDHEFFSESANGDEVGWDWLSLQMDDRSELMLYRLRHKDGSVDPYSSGTYVDSQGRSTHLALHAFTMAQAGETWRSDRTGATYPIAWTVAVPELQLQLQITTPVKQQEFVSRFGPSYWEGAIDVTGRHHDKPIAGTGYLEMTGYSQGKGPLFSGTPR